MNHAEGLDRFGQAAGGATDRAAICAPVSLRDRLSRIAHHFSTAQGRSVTFEASRDHLVYLLKGDAKLVAGTPGVQDRIVSFHCAGDLVTVPAASHHAYVLVALRDCDLMAFDRAELLAQVRQEPDVLEAVFSKVVDGLERCRSNAVNLGRKSATMRVANFLLTTALRNGQARAGALVVDLPMTRRDISDYLGLTIETISRQISEMRKKGLIATPTRTRVELLDCAQLQARAHLFAGAE